jgi:membrane protein YdbS with pleckstrin-like domain
MKDKYFLKKEKVADLLFDLVKYLLTAITAGVMLSEKPINLISVIAGGIIAIIIFIVAVRITPAKEE